MSEGEDQRTEVTLEVKTVLNKGVNLCIFVQELYDSFTETTPLTPSVLKRKISEEHFHEELLDAEEGALKEKSLDSCLTPEDVQIAKRWEPEFLFLGLFQCKGVDCGDRLYVLKKASVSNDAICFTGSNVSFHSAGISSTVYFSFDDSETDSDLETFFADQSLAGGWQSNNMCRFGGGTCDECS